MKQFFMAASHATEKGSQPDPVFSVLKRANAAIAELGPDKVINASIGAIYDEEERFAFLPSVHHYMNNLEPEELMNYAPIGGLEDFNKAVIAQVFGKYFPVHMFAGSVATPVGTGAVRHAIHNYMEQGEKVLVPDWCWGNYRTIAEEDGRDIDTYLLFDDKLQYFDDVAFDSREPVIVMGKAVFRFYKGVSV
ncbi:MAG: aminotransferase class I/II-fold pyridoxal phosphate-dependent enzyme [Dehalobacterium sp.]